MWTRNSCLIRRQKSIMASMDQSIQIDFFSAPPEGKNRMTLLICLAHPLSRGSVHITTTDPLQPPRIDAGYFRNNVDAKILAEGVKWLGRVAEQPVLKKNLKERVLPPERVKLESEEERVDHVRNHISTQYHLIGTCAMSEVVDARLKVKGVEGLRVVDASVFPVHVSGNIMASTYGVAEKGADLIKEDDGRYMMRVDSGQMGKRKDNHAEKY